jgi:LPS-assembly lipoprotein
MSPVAHNCHESAHPTDRRSALRFMGGAVLSVVVALGLSGCGFQLRGSGVQMAFASLRIQGPDNATVSQLRDQLRASGVVMVEGSIAVPAVPATSPDAVLDLLQDQRERVVVGTTAAGQVRELVLRQRVRFRLRTPAGKELIPAIEVLQEREMSFTETQVLGKEAEEALLYRDMQNAVVRQIMARLAAVKGL